MLNEANAKRRNGEHCLDLVYYHVPTQHSQRE